MHTLCYLTWMCGVLHTEIQKLHEEFYELHTNCPFCISLDIFTGAFSLCIVVLVFRNIVYTLN